MLYVYEETKGLKQRMVNYVIRIQNQGVMSIEKDIEKEQNSFLKILLDELSCSASPIKFRRYKIFIKDYINKLTCKKKEKLKIKKQLNMIYNTMKAIPEDETFFPMKKGVYLYSRKILTRVGDYVKVKINQKIVYAEVTDIIADWEMIVIKIKGKKKELGVSESQIIENFDKEYKLEKMKPFVYFSLADGYMQVNYDFN